MKACREYALASGRRVTFEYALIDGVNDSTAHARELVQITREMARHINLIPLNPIPECAYNPSGVARTRAFQRVLDGAGVSNTLRASRGADIQAGCGQLRARTGDVTPGGRTHQ
jgi:23S rRNA (adenine2503-C2)-methyltransferase